MATQTKETSQECDSMMNSSNMQGHFSNKDHNCYIKVTKDCIIWNVCDDGRFQNDKNSSNVISRRSAIQTSDDFVAILPYYVELSETLYGRSEENVGFGYDKNDDSWTMTISRAMMTVLQALQQKLPSNNMEPDENPVIVCEKEAEIVQPKQKNSIDVENTDNVHITAENDAFKMQFKRTSYVSPQQLSVAIQIVVIVIVIVIVIVFVI